MVEKLESNNERIVDSLRERFHYEAETVKHSEEYLSCNSTKPRKLAKQKMDVILKKYSESSGDCSEIVLDAFAQIIIDNVFSEGQIRQIIAPMLDSLR